MVDGSVYVRRDPAQKRRIRKLGRELLRRSRPKCEQCGDTGFVSFQNDRFGGGYSTRRCSCNPYPEE